jgi:hypothetical protein
MSQTIGRDPYHKLNHHRKAGAMKDKPMDQDITSGDEIVQALNSAASRENRWRQRAISAEKRTQFLADYDHEVWMDMHKKFFCESEVEDEYSMVRQESAGYHTMDEAIDAAIQRMEHQDES